MIHWANGNRWSKVHYAANQYYTLCGKKMSRKRILAWYTKVNCKTCLSMQNQMFLAERNRNV